MIDCDIITVLMTSVVPSHLLAYLPNPLGFVIEITEDVQLKIAQAINDIHVFSSDILE